MKFYVKPPLGVLDRETYQKFLEEDIHLNGGMSEIKINEDRASAIKAAMQIYIDVSKEIPNEWLVEYDELCLKIKGRN